MNKHQRHKRIQDRVRAWYQATHPGSRLFVNTSGTGWAGKLLKKDAAKNTVTLNNPFFVQFGIPNMGQGHGGADLIGWHHLNEICLFTAIEVKTGKAKLRENQKYFRDSVISAGGIYRVARECQFCEGDGCEKCDMKGWDFE